MKKSSAIDVENLIREPIDGATRSCKKSVICAVVTSLVLLLCLSASIYFTYKLINKNQSVSVSNEVSTEFFTTPSESTSEIHSESNTLAPKNPFESHRNYKLFDYFPSISETKFRIQGGNLTNLNEFPWHVAIFCQSLTNESLVKYNCGGSLISDNLILTASHCIPTSKIKIHSIRLGEYNMATDPDSQVINDETITTDPIQVYREGEFSVVRHEDYDNSPGENDIALIKLHHPAKISQANIDKIRLPFNHPNLPSSVVATGFGLTENITIASTLRRGRMKVVELGECLRQYQNAEQMRVITEKQFCVKGKNGKITVPCSGDSGGAIQYPTMEDDKLTWIQYGVISWGSNSYCGLKTKPSVAVNVYSYLDWILDNAKDSTFERE